MQVQRVDLSEAFLGRSMIGVVAGNSLEYFRQVMLAYERGEVVVPLRRSDDERISAARVDRVVEPSSTAGGWWREQVKTATHEGLAQISFTSGTEGAAKGVLLTHRNLGDVVLRLNHEMEVDSDIREYIGVPIYHSFGFARCRAVCEVGGTFYLPSSGFNPKEFVQMLSDGTINALSLVPTLCRLLLQSRHLLGECGKKLRWMEIGSQYISRSEKEALKTVFPCAVIVQHYGLTEASRSTFLRIHEAEGLALESVGKAAGQVELRLAADSRIMIRGPHVASQVLLAGSLQTVVDAEGWLTTNDIGELREDLLFYNGRADDIINWAGIKVSPESLEGDIRRSLDRELVFAICRIPDTLRGDGILIAHQESSASAVAELRTATTAALKNIGVSAGDTLQYWRASDFPRTENGKIKRKVLADTYQQNQPSGRMLARLMTGPAPKVGWFSSMSRVEAVFLENFPGTTLCAEDSFVSLSGDSLTYVGVLMALEEIVGRLPDGWERLTIAELQALPDKASSTPRREETSIETPVLVRAIAPILVVMNHSGLNFLAGGAALLLVVVGYNFKRFQFEQLSTGRVFGIATAFLVNVLTPYWLILVAYQLAKGQVSSAEILLYNNIAAQPAVTPFAT